MKPNTGNVRGLNVVVINISTVKVNETVVIA